MRKLILLMHVSLDGFIEGVKGDMSWMQPDTDEQWKYLFSVLEEVDLFVLGRGMWADYRDHWKRALVEPGFSDNDVNYAKLAQKTSHIVFSQTLKDPGWANTTVVNGSLVEEITKIKNQPGKNIHLVGGAKLAAGLMDTGLVDEYHLFVHPVIINKGKSFFQLSTHRHSLELIDVQKLRDGVALLVYKQVSTSVQTDQPPLKRRTRQKK